MSDALNWFENNWPAIVQAVSAVAIGVLTLRLAKATDAYAKSAKDQVDELVQARLATIQPYLHLRSAGTVGEPDPYLIGFGVEVDIANLGSGPALDAVARLWHERLQFMTATSPQTVAEREGCTLSFQVNASTADPGGQALSQDVRLIVEYRDLAGRSRIETDACHDGRPNAGEQSLSCSRPSDQR